MRVKSIRLKNFKRFSDLVIRDIPEEAKLVLVVGPNGSGKSSLFDALLHWYKLIGRFGVGNDFAYYRRSEKEPFDWNQSVTLTFHGDINPGRDSLYVRGAYRNDPDFSVSNLARPAQPQEQVRLQRMIDNDQSVSQNYTRLVYETMTGVYDHTNDQKTVASLREELIGALRISMQNVFGDLVLNNISDPLGTGAFYFGKGTVDSYHYKNLSGGEKAAFDLLLDIHAKKRYFPQAIYCVDEIDVHLHTRVQGTLLHEMVQVIPAESQLWVTTHSLGALRAAQKLAAEKPGSVCLIDFDGVELDTPQEIVPSNLDRVTWEKLLSITLDDLSERVAPQVLIICEGSAIGSKRRNFDAEIYNKVLGSQCPEVVFVSGGASNQVSGAGITIRDTLKGILPTTKVVALVDHDDKSEDEVIEFERKGGIVLPERNIESYLLADDVIEALLKRENKLDLREQVLEVKRQALDNSQTRGNPPDDLKSAAGEIYVELKKLLSLQQQGNSADAFMRDTLAPLIEPGLSTFESLKSAIISRVL